MIAQFIIDQVIKQRSNKPLSSILQAGFQILRKCYLRIKKDKLIEYELENKKILLPISHDLPVIKRNYPYYDSHIGRIPRYLQNKYSDFQIIDIGANVGDTAVIIKSGTDMPIICIEGDELFYSLLVKNTENLKNVFCEKTFIGDSPSGVFTLKKEKGTARLVSDSSSGLNVEFSLLNDVIQGYSHYDNYKFLKIDTDGFDCRIINSSTNFLKKYKPVIFFEYDPFFLNNLKEDGLDIFNTLEHTGYENMLIYDNTGIFLLSCSVFEKHKLFELDLYFSGREGKSYMDICIFHSDDDSVFLQARGGEIDFYKNLKK